MRNKGSLTCCICLYVSFASFTPLKVLATLTGFNPVYPAFNDDVANRHVRRIGALANIAAKGLAAGGGKTKGGRGGAASGMLSQAGKAFTNLAAGGGGSKGGSGATGLDKIKKLTKVAAPLLQLASQLEPNNTLLKTASSLSNGNTEGGTDYMKLADEAAKLASLSGNKKAEQLANQYNNFKKAVGYGQQEGSQQHEGEDGGGKQQEEEHQQKPEGDDERKQKETGQQEDRQEKQEEKTREHRTHYHKKESKQEGEEKSHSRRKGKHSSAEHSARNYQTKEDHRSSRHGYTGSSSKEAQIRKIVHRHAAEMINSAQKLHAHIPTTHTVHYEPTKRRRHSRNNGKNYDKRKKHRKSYKINKHRYSKKKRNHNHYSSPHKGFSLDDLATNYNVLDN